MPRIDIEYLLNKLGEILEKEAELFEELKGKVKEQQKTIINHNISDLGKVLIDQQIILKRVNIIEKSRQNIINKVGRAKKDFSVEMTLSELARAMDETGVNIDTIRDKLLSLSLEIQNINTQNRMLLGKAKELNEKEVQILTGNQSVSVGYSARGLSQKQPKLKTVILNKTV